MKNEYCSAIWFFIGVHRPHREGPWAAVTTMSIVWGIVHQRQQCMWHVVLAYCGFAESSASTSLPSALQQFHNTTIHTMHRALLITHHTPPLSAPKTLLLHAARPCPSLHPPVLCHFLSPLMTSHTPSTACLASSISNVNPTAEEDPLVMYVVLRRDLWQEQQWPLGSIVSQGCHAATAALWDTRDAPSTQAYCAADNIDNMRKVCRAADNRDWTKQPITGHFGGQNRVSTAHISGQAPGGWAVPQAVGGAARELCNMPSNCACTT